MVIISVVDYIIYEFHFRITKRALEIFVIKRNVGPDRAENQ